MERLRQDRLLRPLRRDRSFAAGRQRAGRDARQRHVQRAARTLLQTADDLRLPDDDLQGGRRICRRHARRDRQRRQLAHDDQSGDVQQHLRRRGLRRDARTHGLDEARLRRFVVAGGALHLAARRADRPESAAGEGHGGVPRLQDPQDQIRQVALRHGSELLGRGASDGQGQARTGGADEHLRTVRSRRRLDPDPRRLPRRDALHLYASRRRGARELGAAVHLPRLPLRAH